MVRTPVRGGADGEPRYSAAFRIAWAAMVFPSPGPAVGGVVGWVPGRGADDRRGSGFLGDQGQRGGGQVGCRWKAHLGGSRRRLRRSAARLGRRAWGRWAENALAALAQAYMMRLCRRFCESGRTGSTFIPMREWRLRISMCGPMTARPSSGWIRPLVSPATMASGLRIFDALNNWCSSTTTNC